MASQVHRRGRVSSGSAARRVRLSAPAHTSGRGLAAALVCDAPFPGVIKNVVLSWQASRRAHAIIQQRLAPGYLAWTATKSEMFGHGWSAGFVYRVSSGQLRAPAKTGIWRMLAHLRALATCHRLIHNVPRRPFYSTTLHAPTDTQRNGHTRACVCINLHPL